MKRYEYGNPDSANVLVQLIGDHEVSGMEKEIANIRDSVGDDFFLLAYKVDDWNLELSPWQASAVFGKEDFGGGAGETLKELLEELRSDNVLSEGANDEVLSEKDKEFLLLTGGKDVAGPACDKKKYYIGGYSLAGLFALWAAYQTDLFTAVAAASPSIWFPGFIEHMRAGKINADRVYLSLGNREAKTRNSVMATVADCIEISFDLLRKQGVESVLEWNEGNHFKDADIRTAKAFSWVLNGPLIYEKEVDYASNRS